jgi:hypothetical protein
MNAKIGGMYVICKRRSGKSKRCVDIAKKNENYCLVFNNFTDISTQNRKDFKGRIFTKHQILKGSHRGKEFSGFIFDDVSPSDIDFREFVDLKAPFILFHTPATVDDVFVECFARKIVL